MSNNNSHGYGRFKKTLLAASIMALSSAALSAEKAPEADDEADNDKVEEIVVTGRRHAIEAASEIKRNSSAIVDSVVADDAGKLPDNSITEVLQRIPGITMSRWNGAGDNFVVEGSGIQVRGLSNASSMLNGREIFGANGGGGLSWGEVTPELMAAVDVYKTSTANMIEGGTGGAINLRTKMPFDYTEPSVSGSIGLSYPDLVEKVDGSTSILGTTRFDTEFGEMGILVDVAYSKLRSKSGHLSVEPYYKKFYDANGNGVSDGESEQRYITGGFGWGDDNFQRERTGFYEAFQWAPTDNLTIFQTAFVSKYQSDNNGTGVWVAGDRSMPLNGSATTFDSNGVLVQADQMGYGSVGGTGAGGTIGQGWIPEDQQVDCNTPYGGQAQSLNWSASPPNCTVQTLTAGSSRGFSKSNNVTSDFSQGFTWNINEKTRLKGALQYVRSTAKSSGLSAGLNVPITTYSMDLRGDLPKIQIANSDTMLDPANYAWGAMAWRPTDNLGTMVAPNLDLDIDLGEGFFKTISAGVRYSHRYEEDLYDGTYWEALGNSWDGWEPGQQYLGSGPAEDGEYYGFENFFHGNIQVPHSFYVPSEAMMRSGDYNYLMNTYGYNIGKILPNGQNPTTPFESLHVDYGKSITTVDTSAFYLQTNFGSEMGLFGVPYTGNLGVRYVHTDTEASGNFVFNSSTFYMTQADADADFAADPTGTLKPQAVNLPADVQPLKNDNSNDHFLPTININFKPSESVQIRVAASQSMARPYFGDITVAGNGYAQLRDNTSNYTDTATPPVEHRFLPIFDGLGVTTGNTTLKPTVSTNFDFAFEWYGDHGSAAHVSLFHKSLKDLIIYSDSAVPFDYNFVKNNGETASGTTILTRGQSVNADKNATIQGFEFGARTYFDKLPGFWSGFGLDSNFTYIDSKNPSPKSYDIEGNRFEDLPVTGLSKYSYNIQLMYQKDGFYAGLGWNWRSRFLMSTSANGTGSDDTTYNYYYDGNGNFETIHYMLPLFGKATGTLDFGMDYKFNDNFKIYFKANNLLNEVAKSEMEILPGKFYARNFYEADRRVEAGINFSF
jgi:iron complex outermembrane recepter protein